MLSVHPHCGVYRRSMQFDFRSECGSEGDVCAFELPHDAAYHGRSPDRPDMAIAPGDTFLATPGYRESTRWVSVAFPMADWSRATITACSPTAEWSVNWSATAPSEQGYFGRVRYLGAVCRDRGETLNIRQFAVLAQPQRIATCPCISCSGLPETSGKLPPESLFYGRCA